MRRVEAVLLAVRCCFFLRVHVSPVFGPRPLMTSSRNSDCAGMQACVDVSFVVCSMSLDLLTDQ